MYLAIVSVDGNGSVTKYASFDNQQAAEAHVAEHSGIGVYEITTEFPVSELEWNGSTLSRISQADRDARAVARLEERKQQVASALTQNLNITRAVVKSLVDEINILRQAAGLQPRTMQQVRTAIWNNLDG